MEPENTNWQEVLTEMNNVLTTNGINPSAKPVYNIAIQGSNYLSYRNDNDGNGNYLPANSLTEIPTDTNSPFLNVRIGSQQAHNLGV